MDRKAIQYLAVARTAADGRPAAILAERVHFPSSSYNYHDHVIEVLHSPGWTEVHSDRLSLQDGEHKFHLLVDEEWDLVYIAVATLEYPVRYVFGSSSGTARGCLLELQQQFMENYGKVFRTKSAGELTQPASIMLKSICKAFNDLKNVDKLERVKTQVSEIASLMMTNINSTADISDKMDVITSRTEDLQMLSKDFERQAVVKRELMEKKHKKVAIMFTMVMIILIAIGVITYMAMRKRQQALGDLFVPGNSTSHR